MSFFILTVKYFMLDKSVLNIIIYLKWLRYFIKYEP